MTATDHHFRREDRTRHWQRIAGHVAAHPQDLAVALANLDRWQESDRVHPAPLREWRERIIAAQASRAALDDFVSWLAAPNHDAEPLKSCSPFVGLKIAGPDVSA